MTTYTKLFLGLVLFGACATDDTDTVAQQTAGAPILLPDSGTGQHREVMRSFDPLVVMLTDTIGNPLAGATVTFTSPQSGASSWFELNAQAQTDENGRAELRPNANSIAGTYIVWAHADGAAAMPFVLTNTAGSPTVMLPMLGTNQARALNQPFQYPLTVEVHDSYGNAVPNVPVQFIAPTAGPTTAMPEDGATVTGDDGLAAVFATAGHIPGMYTVMATTAGAPSIPFVLVNTDGQVFPDSSLAEMHTRSTGTVSVEH